MVPTNRRALKNGRHLVMQWRCPAVRHCRSCELLQAVHELERDSRQQLSCKAIQSWCLLKGRVKGGGQQCCTCNGIKPYLVPVAMVDCCWSKCSSWVDGCAGVLGAYICRMLASVIEDQDQDTLHLAVCWNSCQMELKNDSILIKGWLL